MTEAKYSIGDPVWSKMKGYCPWPSRIAGPHESSLKNNLNDKAKGQNPKTSYLVYFFGSNNFAWMPEDTIKPYLEFKEKNKNGTKTVSFKQGLKQIEEYIANGGKEALLKEVAESASAAINQDDSAESPESGTGGDSPTRNDAGGFPITIAEELELIHNKKPAVANKKSLKNSNSDSQNDSACITSPVQRDYSRTPFKGAGRKAAARSVQESTTDIKSSPTKRIKTDNATAPAAAHSSDEDDQQRSLSPIVSTTTTKPPQNSKSTGARNVILRGHYTDLPLLDTPKIDRSYDLPKYKTVTPSKLKFGFVGVGFMGQRLLKHLISTGHNVTIYNRTTSKCKDFVEAGAKAVQTAADVVSASDVVFLCVANDKASKEVVFGNYGILSEMDERKALVEMSSIDPETSSDISEAILSKGGRYLEAPIICSSRTIADNGELVIVAAGSRDLYEDCKTCFSAMAKKTFYVSSSPGSAAKMSLIVSMLYGSMTGALTECCSLIDTATLQLPQFQEILRLSVMNCPLVDSLLTRISDKSQEVHMPVGNIQKAMRLVLNMSEELNSSIPIAAVTNEIFKSTTKIFDSYDISALYLKNRY